LETERCCSAATRNQRLAVIKSFCRYTAVEQPDHLDQVTQVLAIRQKKTPAPQRGHLTGDEVKTLLAEPGTGTARAVRDTVLLALAYDSAARVQDSEAVESLRKIDTLVVDKTGTVTEGKPKLVSVKAAAGYNEETVLRWAASLERASEHPLAAAIVAGAADRGIALVPAQEFKSLTGQGVQAVVEGVKISLGNQMLMDTARIDTRTVASEADLLRADGQTVMYLAAEGKFAGLLGVADPIKATSLEAIRQLQQEGIRIVMLTGDSKVTAQAVASKLGLDEVIAEVLPEDKRAKIEELQNAGRFVAMAGDGINDAPALAQAHVGIAMGTGTDVAMESAGVTLVKGDLRGIARARQLSHATMRNIRQNLFFAFVYNALGVPIAAGALYPWFGILLSPIIASAAMSLSSVSVVGNALRLRSVRI